MAQIACLPTKQTSSQSLKPVTACLTTQPSRTEINRNQCYPGSIQV